MNSQEPRKISTDPYKGVRDFYPADQAVQNYITGVWKNVLTKYGYEEYNASVLEPSELYHAKSGEEIVNEQTYSFKDRGDRDVTLRPEMTPTVARMVAGRRRELAFPLRWFSIPNLFRYEQPQRGRLREHWQLNVDLFGVTSTYAEVEVIQIAYDIMHAYGIRDDQFEIRINNRKIMQYMLRDIFEFDTAAEHTISKLIDKKQKMTPEAFKASILEVAGTRTQEFLTLLNSKSFAEFTSHLPSTARKHEGLKEITAVIEALENLGITNAVFDQTLMRGFDYYTGVVFEIFDTNPTNRRSVFGGGRYDDLLSLFGNDKVPAVGFGTGDVVIRDILETYGLLPATTTPFDLYICPMNASNIPLANDIAQEVRENSTRVAVDYTDRKLGDKIKTADKYHARFVLCIGDDEANSNSFKIKNLTTGEEVASTRQALASHLI